jgi:NADH-quinone oxidoreductase subunit M
VLNLLLFLPLLAATAIGFGSPTRKTAIAASFGMLATALALLFQYDRGNPEFQFVSSVSVLPAWDLKYLLAADGLSLLLLLLTAAVTLSAVWVSPTDPVRPRLFYSSLLLISAGAVGAFASQDLFFFYAFHELALIPTFLLLGIWGTGERHTAAWKITIYLAVGSFILLIGLVDLYHAIPSEFRTFDMIKLQKLATQQVIPAAAQARPYLFLLVGFGILVSLFPFHTWAPDAYASAPTPAAMLHAGVLKKFGLYGLIRVAIPLLPAGAQHWAWLLLILLVGNVLYVGLVTIAQKRLDQLLGFSSVMHMGYIFLGIAAANSIGLSGACLLMFAHGLSIAALFALCGHLRSLKPGLSLDGFGGLGRTAPFLGATFGLAAFASIGLPGFGNFASEMLVFFGAFKPAAPAGSQLPFQIATGCAIWGVVISAVYMLRAYRSVFLGPVTLPPTEETKAWAAAALQRLRLPLVLLLGLLLYAGFVPGNLLAFVKPSIEALLPR